MYMILGGSKTMGVLFFPAFCWTRVFLAKINLETSEVPVIICPHQLGAPNPSEQWQWHAN